MSRPSPKRTGAAGLPRIHPVLRRCAAALAALLFLSGPLAAQTVLGTSVRSVVELFTSQGCSSCPSADDVLTGLASDESVLALSYHVDYWDYIGWSDPLASVRSGERQRGYIRAMGLRTVYTPQMIVNGSREVSAANGPAVRRMLAEDALSEGGADLLRLSRDDSTLHITARAPSGGSAGTETVLVLVTYRKSTTTEVERGENTGRRLVNTHAVHDWQIIGKIMDRTLDLDMPLATLRGVDSEATECAVLLQTMNEDGTPGAILAAAKLAL